MNDRYILVDGVPTPEPDLIKWAEWFEQTDARHLASDEVGEVRVSTVFLGMDHSFGGSTPILWETMIFGGEHDDYQERYSTREAALAGHAKALALVKGGKS